MSQTSYEPPIAGLPATPARPPWRLRLAIVLVAFSVASPIIVALVWLAAHHPPGFGPPASAAPIPGAPGPYDPDMAAAYRSYLEKEGHSQRGAAFADCAMRLNMLMVPGGARRKRSGSEAEILFYLGPPDLVYDVQGSSTYAYFYDRFATRDWVVYIVVADSGTQRVVTQIGWNARSASSHADFRPYSTTWPSNATRPE